LIYNLIKTFPGFPPVFHWAQAALTRYSIGIEASGYTHVIHSRPCWHLCVWCDCVAVSGVEFSVDRGNGAGRIWLYSSPVCLLQFTNNTAPADLRHALLVGYQSLNQSYLFTWENLRKNIMWRKVTNGKYATNGWQHFGSIQYDILGLPNSSSKWLSWTCWFRLRQAVQNSSVFSWWQKEVVADKSRTDVGKAQIPLCNFHRNFPTGKVVDTNHESSGHKPSRMFATKSVPSPRQTRLCRSNAI